MNFAPHWRTQLKNTLSPFKSRVPLLLRRSKLLRRTPHPLRRLRRVWRPMRHQKMLHQASKRWLVTTGKTVADKVETPEQREARQRVDRAPQSWKGESKKLWETLPLNVRQEVARRERDITKVMNETAHVRQQVSQMQEVFAPHMDRINTVYGGNTATAINNLLSVERQLFNGTPQDKAQLVANMVKQFNIDVLALDAAIVRPAGSRGGRPAVEHRAHSGAASCTPAAVRPVAAAARAAGPGAAGTTGHPDHRTNGCRSAVSLLRRGAGADGRHRRGERAPGDCNIASRRIH